MNLEKQRSMFNPQSTNYWTILLNKSLNLMKLIGLVKQRNCETSLKRQASLTLSSSRPTSPTLKTNQNLFNLKSIKIT